jgi:MFS family permease
MNDDSITTKRSCINCCYDLAGLPIPCTCPECGINNHDPSTPTTETLDAFTICPTCGYNLGGLPRHSQCPECGSPTQEAIVEHSIYRAGSAHVASIARGASLVLLAHYIFLGAFVILISGTLFAGAIGAATRTNMGPTGGLLIGSGAFLLMILSSGIVWLVGWMKATRKDPVFGYYPTSERRRGSTRGLAITLFCITAASVMCMIVPLANTVIFFAQVVCGIIMFYFSTAYIRAIATRIPSAKLESSATRVRTVGTVVFVCIAGAIAITILLAVLESYSIGDSLEIISGFIALFIVIAGLVGTLAYLRVLTRFAKILKQAKLRAESTPTKTEPPPDAHLQGHKNSANVPVFDINRIT